MTGAAAPATGPDSPTRPEARRRSGSVDLFKFLLAVMVVGVHVPLFADLHPDAGTLLTQGLYRIAVPAFLCLTGYYLALGRPGTWQKATRRFLLLFLIWSVIYAPTWADDVLAADHPLRAMIEPLLFGFWHLWYLAALCVALPLLALLYRLPSPLLLGLATALFLAGFALQHAHLLTGQALTLPLPLYRNGLFLALPFLILGHLLRRHALPERIGPTRLAVLALAATALLLAEALLMQRLAGHTGFADFRLALLPAAPAATALALSLAAHPLGTAMPRDLGAIAMGLYLLHPGVFIVLTKFGLPSTTAATLLILALSTAGAVLLARTRLSRLLL